MWPRILEVALACWLAASPFIFGHPHDARFLWAHDLLGGLAVATFALLSYWRPTRRAHIVVALLGVWLIAYGWLSAEHPPSAAVQNHILVGLLLLMLGIIPGSEERPLPQT